MVMGACGFSTGRGDEWPGVNTVALPPSLVLGLDLPQAGCGACFEVQCGSGGNNSSEFSQVGRWLWRGEAEGRQSWGQCKQLAALCMDPW